jgi:hypothetical protein
VVEDALEVGIGAEGRIGLDVVDRQHVIDTDLHVLVADLDVHAEPLVVCDQLLADVAHGVEGAGLFALAGVGVGHLHLKAGGGKTYLLVRGVEVDAGVGVGAGEDVGGELEVFEVGVVRRADVEKMRAVAVDLNLAVDDREGSFMLAGAPTVERLAVEEGDPAVVAAVVAVGGGIGCGRSGQHEGENVAAGESGHGASETENREQRTENREQGTGGGRL